MNNLSVSRAANTPQLLLALQAKAEIERRRRAGTNTAGQRFAGYRDDPAAYAREVLGIEWWPRQVEIASSIHHNRRTVVYAGHSVGKTHSMGGIVQWHFDCWDPSITLTTAPSWSSIHDLLWGELKSQRPPGTPGRLLDLRLDGGPMHYAAGHNAESGSGFQGRHEARVLIVLDEAMGVPPYIWEATNAMLTSPDCRVIALGSPTETSGEYYNIRENPDWNVITISCLDHPNIAAELRGEPAPFPKAVSLIWKQGSKGRSALSEQSSSGACALLIWRYCLFQLCATSRSSTASQLLATFAGGRVVAVRPERPAPMREPRTATHSTGCASFVRGTWLILARASQAAEKRSKIFGHRE